MDVKAKGKHSSGCGWRCHAAGIVSGPLLYRSVGYALLVSQAPRCRQAGGFATMSEPRVLQSWAGIPQAAAAFPLVRGCPALRRVTFGLNRFDVEGRNAHSPASSNC